MTAKRLWSIGALVILAGFAWGCGEDSTGPYFVDDGPYLPQTSPENVLHNLQASYERREIGQYAVLLDPEYARKFLEGDIPADLPRDYWNRDEDSTMTAALFDDPEVSSIRLELGPFAVDAAGRVDMPGAMRVRLAQAKFELEQASDTTLVVRVDIQDLYLRRGDAAAGTDSTKWYLLEWHDLGGEWSAILREVGK